MEPTEARPSWIGVPDTDAGARVSRPVGVGSWTGSTGTVAGVVTPGSPGWVVAVARTSRCGCRAPATIARAHRPRSPLLRPRRRGVRRRLPPDVANRDGFSPPTMVMSTVSRGAHLCIPRGDERRANRRCHGVTVLVMTPLPADVYGAREHPSPHLDLGLSLWGTTCSGGTRFASRTSQSGHFAAHHVRQVLLSS